MKIHKDSADERSPSRIQRPSGGQGVVYVVATPIGNLEDITLRALKVLETADLIAAEKVSRTRALCRHHGIKTRVIGYRRSNSKAVGPALIRRVKGGETVALVTDAGTPGVSDPGVCLVSQALDEGIKVSPIPGPSAVIAGLSVSGMPSEEFVFCGFPPNRPGRRKNRLKTMASESRTLVFFEAPHRIESMLRDLREILGDRKAVVLRELTKAFEEVRRGTITAILAGLDTDNLRGEFTVVVAGCGKTEAPEDLGPKVRERLTALLKRGEMSVKDIASLLSTEEGIAFRQAYKACLARKKDLERIRMNGAQ